MINAILDKDREYSSSPSPDLYTRRFKVQTEHDLLTTSKAEYILRRTKGTYYEYGEKASRLLGLHLKRPSASHFISQVYDSSHLTITDPTEISFRLLLLQSL